MPPPPPPPPRRAAAGRRGHRRRAVAAAARDGIDFPQRPTPDQLAHLHRYLQRIYYDERNGGGFSTPGKLWHEIRRRGYYRNVGVRRIEQFLNRLAPFSIFRPSRGKFPTPPVKVRGPLIQFDMDLVDVSRQAESNDGTRFLLTAIDVFTKYAYAVPLLSKIGQHVAEAADDIFDDRQPERVCTDLGSEFKSQPFQTMLQRRGIKHFYAGGSGKCTVVERFHRTLKTRIARYQRYLNVDRYIDGLQGIIEGYNKSYHRTIKTRPIDVDEQQRDQVFFDSYSPKQPPKTIKHRLVVGDNVRIAAERHLFLREHFQRWSEELFKISKRWRKHNINMYKVEDCTGEQVIGSFYAAELTKVEGAEDELYRIERVLDEKVENGVRMIKVKYVGYSDRCAKWIRKRDVRAAR